jgi:hypothetical protein
MHPLRIGMKLTVLNKIHFIDVTPKTCLQSMINTRFVYPQVNLGVKPHQGPKPRFIKVKIMLLSTVIRPALVSSHIWCPRPDFCYCHTEFIDMGFPSLTRGWVYSLQSLLVLTDRLCGLVVRVLGYRSGGPGSIPGTTRKKK